jgi:thymidylate synthase (FAD)
MIVVEPSFEILFPEDKVSIYKKIELIGRTCYLSWDKTQPESYIRFMEMVMKRRHYALLEHINISVKWVVDRGLANEMVRHRIASFAQESTIFCNYTQAKFGNQIAVIYPKEIGDNLYAAEAWQRACEQAEQSYMVMIKHGMTPAIARSVLPICLKAEVVSTFNIRQWRHFFTMRDDIVDHPFIHKMAHECLLQFQEWMPEIYNSVQPYSKLKDDIE